MMKNQNPNGSFCCDTYVDYLDGNSFDHHDYECDNYHGISIESPILADVYYSGTGEMIGDDSYIDYLNR